MASPKDTHLNKFTAILQNFMGEDSNSSNVRRIFRIMALALGGLHTYAAIQSQSMNADGIAYLDIGDAYFRADWTNAINTVWSPLYSWILGLANFIVKPSMEWAFPVVHIVNFAIFLFTLSSFEFMWTCIRRRETHRLSSPQWWTLGYLLFIWASLSLIQIWSVTPDLLMAGFVCIAAGLLAQIRAGQQNYRPFIGLGIVLGLGYLTKTFMFIVALVFLVLAGIIQPRTWSAFKKSLLAASVFLLISLPFILLISNVKGKFTIGDSGRVTYVRHVLRIPYPHWQGDPSQSIYPSHPSRIVHDSPRIFEFGEPIGGTYPISTDPSYWYEGIEAQVHLKTMLPQLFVSSLFYVDLFFQELGILLACVVALYFMGLKSNLTLLETVKKWLLVIPAVIAFGLYGLVLVAKRYIGVFVLLFWADLLANIQLTGTPKDKSWLKVLSVIASVGLLVNILLFNVDGFTRFNPSVALGSQVSGAPPARPLAVAQALVELGIKPGDRVGVIGYGYDSFWARLAGVKIVAEMLEEDAHTLWRGGATIEQGVLKAFEKTAVEAVVAEYVPEYANMEYWHRVSNSNYYIYIVMEK